MRYGDLLICDYICKHLTKRILSPWELYNNDEHPCMLIQNTMLPQQKKMFFRTFLSSIIQYSLCLYFTEAQGNIGVSADRLIALNMLRPRQNDRYFPDDVLKWIFLNGNVWISIKISLKFVPSSPINNFPALVQIMVWRRPGDKPLSGPMMVSLLYRPASISWCHCNNAKACIIGIISIQHCGDGRSNTT